MIYTIGYQNITLNQLLEIMEEKDIDLLIDVRSSPYSRNPLKQEFNRNRLINEFGDRYVWQGKICGGLKGPVKEACIGWLVLQEAHGNALLLMCMENHPCDCHRLCDISRRLAKKRIRVIHLFDGQEKTTDELSEEFCKERRLR